MYRLAIVSLLVLTSLLTACPPPPSPPTESVGSCDWDHVIPTLKAEEGIEMWEEKWESGPNVDFIPDSFLISRAIIEELVAGYCGFRVSYTLSTPKDIISMGITISAMTGEFANPNPDDSLLYIDQQIMEIWHKTGQIPVQKIDIEMAALFQENWAAYNGICIENDTLGNDDCFKERNPPIPPEGSMDDDLTQLVPMSQAYSADTIFSTLKKDFPDYEGILFVCALLPAEIKNLEPPSGKTDKQNKETGSLPSPITTDFRYDFVLRALVPDKSGGSQFQPFLNRMDSTGRDVNIDLSCPCPGKPCCDPTP